MSDEDDNKSNAFFKLSLLETVGADPLLKPIDHSLTGAYLRFMKWPSRHAYLSNMKARILTGMQSEPTITSSRARLVKYGYFEFVMTKLNGCVLFMICNPRQQTVSDHIIMSEEKLKEMDAYRKSEERRKRVIKSGLTKETYTPEEPVNQNNFRDITKIIYDNSLEDTYQEEAMRKEVPFNNPYLSRSRGGF